jgi:C1A family cysteine protease
MDACVWKKGLGWVRDLPDFRDFRVDTDKVPLKLQKLGQEDSVKAMLKKVGLGGRLRASLPAKTDLRPWCSEVEDQGSLGSCTANAGVGLVEYFEKKAFGKHVDASRLFLYKVTRNLLHWTGDTGAYLRTVMSAMVLFGVPPEEYWPYEVERFDEEPLSFLYAYAQSYQAISYYRLDPPGTDAEDLLKQVKQHLAADLPSMFGFTVYSSISQADETGRIPLPTDGEKILGGHAIAAVGYDDNLKIKNSDRGGVETKGAFLIRNSWGTGWGEKGYGWLPYEYVRRGLAVDWWSLLKNEWVNTGEFKA